MKKNILIDHMLKEMKELELIVNSLRTMNPVHPVIHDLITRKFVNLQESLNNLLHDKPEDIFQQIPSTVEVITEFLLDDEEEEMQANIVEETIAPKQTTELPKEPVVSVVAPKAVVEEKQPIPTVVEKQKPTPIVQEKPTPQVEEKPTPIVEEIPIIEKTPVAKTVAKAEPSKSIADLSPNKTSKVDARLITDLRRAIGINDRFRFKRELFGGNEKLMMDTIDSLNTCLSLTEAEDYIQSNFQWQNDNETYVYFMDILHKRFAIPKN